VAADAGRHRAVERVDAQLDAAQQVVDVPDAEQVPRPVLGQLLRRPPHDLVHLRLVAAQRAADGQAERRPRSHLLGAPAPQVLLDAALDDAVDGLLGRAVALVPEQAAVEPAVRPLGRARGVLARDVERQALVEDQRDVRPERGLHGHRRLRPEELLRAVDVGAEAHALLVDAEDGAGPLGALGGGRASLDLVRHGPVPHGEHLEATGVGDHRLVPAHEAVHTAEALHQLRPGREEQVEGVREHHVVAERAGLGHLERLHDGLGGQRHERRRADLAVREPERPRAGARSGIAGADGEGRRHAAP
jgi:hypothetical protein